MPQSDNKKEDVAMADRADATYTRERLLLEAEALTGHPRHVVAGAISGGKLGDKAELTLEEVSKAVETFLASPVGDEEEGV